MKNNLRLFFILIFFLQNGFSQVPKVAGKWCLDKEPDELKNRDTVTFTEQELLTCNTFNFSETGSLSKCIEINAIESQDTSIRCNWERIGLWNYEAKILTIQTGKTIINLKLISSSNDRLLFRVKDYYKGHFTKRFPVKDSQIKNMSEYTSGLDHSSVQVEFWHGAGYNLVDRRTKAYINNYQTISFGYSFHYKNFLLSHSFYHTQLSQVKSNFKSVDGTEISSYRDGIFDFWRSAPYFLLITRHSLELGYEKDIGNMWSIQPSIGLGIMKFDISIDSSTKHTESLSLGGYGDFGIASGCNIGISIKKYFYGSDDLLFIRIYNSLNFYNVKAKFPVLGNAYLLYSLSMGLRLKHVRKKSK